MFYDTNTMSLSVRYKKTFEEIDRLVICRKSIKKSLVEKVCKKSKKGSQTSGPYICCVIPRPCFLWARRARELG